MYEKYYDLVFENDDGRDTIIKIFNYEGQKYILVLIQFVIESNGRCN